jgi:hypothetical protein
MEINYAKVIVRLAIEEMKKNSNIEWVVLFEEPGDHLKFVVMP